MTKKTNTISLQGKEYAQVKDRILAFRSDCPNGLIETTPKIENGQIMFSARVLKDKADNNSAEATGHSFGEYVAGQTKDKAFEKLETIAIGRALAVIGYASDGEIASSEEMEEFMAYKTEKQAEVIAEATKKLKSTKSLEELGKVWSALLPRAKTELNSLKNELKEKYETK